MSAARVWFWRRVIYFAAERGWPRVWAFAARRQVAALRRAKVGR